MEILYAILSVFIVSLISLIGVFTLSFHEKKLKKILIYLVSFSAGVLLGDAFIHILPEAVKQEGFSLSISLMILLGIFVSFFIEKVIHWRHCHLPNAKEHVHSYATMNIVGDSVHNFLDGMILAASFLVSIPIGIATTIAVIFHEIPQEIGDFAILLHGGYSKSKALWFNFLTALTSFAGLFLVFIFGSFVLDFEIFFISFAAGGFIYIAAVDLIPELHKEIGLTSALWQGVIFILGVSIMVLLLQLG